MDLQEIPPERSKISLPDQTPHTRTTIRKMEDHMINSQINHSIKTMEIDLEMDLSTIRMETSETLEMSLVLHRLKGKTFTKEFILATKKRST